jgi:hypothetical protein
VEPGNLLLFSYLISSATFKRFIMTLRQRPSLLVVLAGLGAVFTAQAESGLTASAAAGASASARLDFRVTVPKVIFVSVGTASAMAANPTIDRVDFNVPAGDVGSGNPTAASSGTGAYPVVARVVSNEASVSFTANGSLGGLTNGVQSIPWSQIVPVAGGSLPHPAIGDGAAGAPSNLTATGGVVDRSATWNFSYRNSAPLAAGNYGGQVVYTASLP